MQAATDGLASSIAPKTNKMATAKMRVKRRVEDLDMKVLKDLSMLLNPRMMCGEDWRNLAGKFGMKYVQILNIDERERNPSLAVLKDWWAEPGDRTVSVLLAMLTDMKRADCVRLLEPFEYYGMIMLFCLLVFIKRRGGGLKLFESKCFFVAL